MIKLFASMVLIFLSERVLFAEIPGTARSNERDLMRLDFNLALASPSPGVGLGTSILRTFHPAHAYGLAINISHHKAAGKYERLNTQAFDFVWEHSTALFEGFHALRLRGGLGAANTSVKKDGSTELAKPAWKGHGMASVAFDVPVADLIWLRLGFVAQQSLAKNAPLQTALMVGGVMGGQWVGVGD